MTRFTRQFVALSKKNVLILSKHPFLNILRAFILPIAYGIFLAVAQLFLSKPNNNGLGTPTPIQSVESTFTDKGFAFVWADPTNVAGEIMARVTSGFSDEQKSRVVQVENDQEVVKRCPQNFNLFSECFIAVVFHSPTNYTIRADGGLFHVDVQRHNSDFEKRVFPVQWAIDSAIIELTTGQTVNTPSEWPFTIVTNEQQSTDIRLSYIRGLRTLLVLALFICYIGIAYQLPGSIALERSTLLTSHMRAMGLLDTPRILSWHTNISFLYLPAWVLVALVWHYRIFTQTHVLLVLIIHLLLGCVLASWSFFVAAPFGKSPQLAAVSSTFLSIVFAILALVFGHASTLGACIFSLLFPPSFYIFAIRCVCGWENNLLATNALKPDPDSHLRLLPLLIVALVDVFLWPCIAVWLERRIYDAKRTSKRQDLPEGIAISLKNVAKTFSTGFFKKNLVTAIDDLSLDIPKTGIFVLLGSNGAGKSTTLSILAGLTGQTSGEVIFAEDKDGIGIVPQKNVLFPELNALQHLALFQSIKSSSSKEDLVALLESCALPPQSHCKPSSFLSGGQKRKLQLAIGLVGGSKVVLVDECTSGVDPSSRRGIWRTLTQQRERTIVFTTHFLDEADLLADYIAILGAPGRLLAEGTPVGLKRELGEGYTVHVTFAHSDDQKEELLPKIKAYAPNASIESVSPSQVVYHLKEKESPVVEKVLKVLDEDNRVKTYDVVGSSIEDVFLNLMNESSPPPSDEEETPPPSTIIDIKPSLNLTTGKHVPPLTQSKTIFYKRYLIVKRAWLTPLLAVLVAILGSTIPLVFVQKRQATCVRRVLNSTNVPLWLPQSPIALGAFRFDEPLSGSSVFQSPPNVISTIIKGNATRGLRTTSLQDNQTFVQTFEERYRKISLGGVSVDLSGGNVLVAWEATPPGLNGAALVNLASNILLNRALGGANADGNATIIEASYESFPPVSAGTLFLLKWVAFFGAAMSVYPAFFALYVSKERRSSVQAMQFSNGLANPLGLYLGHLGFDLIFSVVAATIIVIVFAVASNQFHVVGLLWVVLVLYGITSTLFAYVATLIVPSPLAAFAAVAGYQVVMFVLYLAGYLLTLTYAKTSEAGDIITIIHFTLSLLSPVASIIRAALVSVNLFSLLCTGDNTVSTADTGTILRYGGPILYLILYSFALMGILLWADSGSIFKRRRIASNPDAGDDVIADAEKVAGSDDALRVLNISKSFGRNKVVDNVTLGVPSNMIFALLGPNGAGKTTTFNIIRGDIVPDRGDVFIGGHSVIRNPGTTRFSLGVCPQFTAIDSQLTVREHLIIYGRLKGLQKGPELDDNVTSILTATRLLIYADRLATKLSGGNQRKLSLAIALIGNPPVVLIDEFSTGIDAKMKREMWTTLRDVAVGKAVIITTHSMEEASALANKVGILAKRMLAVGTPESLSERYGSYEIHFSCRNREEVAKAQALMSHIPESRMADDVATRFEVPIQSQNGSLSRLFHILSTQGEFSEYTVEKGTLESVFMKVIRENNVDEDDSEKARTWFCL